MRTHLFVLAFGCLFQAAAAEVRLTNDTGGGYVSAYTIGTGNPHTDPVIAECSISRGRQNEPAVAVDPRDTRVLLGGSNDYCGVYAGSTTTFVPAGPIWLGYYRSENSGASFISSLVPGYPGDDSPFAAMAHIRTASAGDPVIAWDKHGRAYFGAESSDDPAGSKKTFGDVWVARFENPDGPSGDTIKDGKFYTGTSLVAKGTSAPNLLGKFHDKTAIEADRTSSACEGNVYFAWTRFNTFGSNIYFSRSTDNGSTWSNPMLLTSNIQNVQDPDIAVTGNGHVYVTFDMGATVSGQTEGVGIAKSTDCGKTFSKPTLAASYIGYAALDVSNPQPVPPQSMHDDRPAEAERGPSQPVAIARDCGDFASACKSGYTFFRRGTTTRSTADQLDAVNEWVYIVYDASKPGTEMSTGNTYGTLAIGTASQTGVYFVRYDGATGAATTPKLIDSQTVGHQLFPDISADGGVLHVLWWDSRHEASYSVSRPIGNDASGHVGPSLDVYATRSGDHGVTWDAPTRKTTASTNPNYEQFSDRTVPFAGDYLWITSVGNFAFGAWTDWRETVSGTDPREPAATDGADVKQCRTFSAATGWTGDQCPHDGGIDQNILGSLTP